MPTSVDYLRLSVLHLLFAASAVAAAPSDSPLVEIKTDPVQIAKAASAPASHKRLTYAIPVAISNIHVFNGQTSVGAWQDLGNGWSLWQFSVKSLGAQSLDFGFSSLDLPKSGVLGIQSRVNPSDFVTISQNTLPADRGEFWTAMVKGDVADFSLWVPTAERAKVRLALAKANHGFIDIGKSVQKSGSCNVDTVCTAGQQVAPQARSVARYTFGGFLCTGALVANTGAEPLTPYMLTAHHCIESASQARSMVLYWGYESDTCRSGAASGTPLSTTRRRAIQMGGADLVATNAESDFSLVRLSRNVPAEANAFWSGWSTDMGPRGAYVLHHPAGHEKRVSYTDAPLHPYAYGGSTNSGSHFHLPYYSVGTTEGGSSGAPLYNAAGAIIGQLHGGPASCATSGVQGPNSGDYYGTVRASYTGGGTPETRLSDWLDPAGLAASGGTVPGYNPDGTRQGAAAETRGVAHVERGLACVRASAPSGGRYWLNCSVTVAANGGSALTMALANIPWGSAGSRDPVAFLTSPTGFQYPAQMVSAPGGASNPVPLGLFWSYHQQIDRLAGRWTLQIGSRNSFGDPAQASGELQFHVSY